MRCPSSPVPAPTYPHPFIQPRSPAGEAGRPRRSILADVGMEGMLWGEVLMASQDRRMDQKTAVGHRV